MHMNRAQLFLTSFFLWSACAMPLLAQEQIAWLTDLRQARQIAEQQQRYVLLHFWSESCGPCRSLEQNVFNQPELIRVLTTHFVPVKINVMQQQKFAEFYKIDRVPTDIIVDTQGREISRRISPSQARDYLAMLDQARVQPTITLASNPGAGAAPPRPSSLLPPREGSEEAEPTSEPINVDPRSLHGSPPHASRWGQAGGQPAPLPTIVHIEV
ncbi:MAG: thioredoxin family protein, partial [Pirellulaceae bacterium]